MWLPPTPLLLIIRVCLWAAPDTNHPRRVRTFSPWWGESQREDLASEDLCGVCREDLCDAAAAAPVARANPARERREQGKYASGKEAKNSSEQGREAYAPPCRETNTFFLRVICAPTLARDCSSLEFLALRTLVKTLFLCCNEKWPRRLPGDTQLYVRVDRAVS